MYNASSVFEECGVMYNYSIFKYNEKYYAVKSTLKQNKLLLFEKKNTDEEGYFFEITKMDKDVYKYVDYMVLVRIDFQEKIKEDNNVTKMEFDEMVSFFLEKKISFEIAGYIDKKIIKRVIKENHLIYDGDKVNNKKFENDSYYVAVSDLEDINKYNIL